LDACPARTGAEPCAAFPPADTVKTLFSGIFERDFGISGTRDFAFVSQSPHKSRRLRNNFAFKRDFLAVILTSRLKRFDFIIYSQGFLVPFSFRVVSRRVALRCVALRCVALRCVALRCVALRCVALHCVDVNCADLLSSFRFA
jgi:hypothetical protein